MKQYLHGWRIFFELLAMQRTKKHGKGKRDWLTAIYCAACGQYIVDYQHRTPLKFPLHGRIAQWLANLKYSGKPRCGRPDDFEFRHPIAHAILVVVVLITLGALVFWVLA